MEIKEFEIDFDGQRNGNELRIKPDEWGSLNVSVPKNYQSGSVFKLTPTVTPIVDFSTQFSIGGQAEATFDLKKAIPALPSWINNTEIKAFGETPYTPPQSFTNKFNPFVLANIRIALPEINLNVS